MTVKSDDPATVAKLEPALKLIHANEASSTGCSGVTWADRRYELRHRLETAQDLLARTNLPLSHIAARTGFYDASVFGKCLRELEGVTPRKHRMDLQSMIRTKS